ncbi:MAG: hypothetical protein HYU68_04665 [Bacteroidetes bacterium]|nr:hypothetical protein [Bacteroidota bacterium]
MKNLKSFTKILFAAVLITGFSVNASAQKEEKKEKVAEELKRPEKVGHSATDSYVDSSFDLYEKNQELTKKLGDLKNHAGDVKSIKSDLESQQQDVTGLLEKSEAVIKEAKTITPKTNSLKAVKAVTQATKALNATKEALPGQIEQIKHSKGCFFCSLNY